MATTREQRQIVGEEHAAMSACFETLRNDGIHTVCFKPERFLDGGRGRENFRAPPFYAGE